MRVGVGIPSTRRLAALGLHCGKIRFLLVSLTCLGTCPAQRTHPAGSITHRYPHDSSVDCFMLPLVVGTGSVRSPSKSSYPIKYPAETPAFRSLPSTWSPLLIGHLCPIFPCHLCYCSWQWVTPTQLSPSCRDYRPHLRGQEKTLAVPLKDPTVSLSTFYIT